MSEDEKLSSVDLDLGEDLRAHLDGLNRMKDAGSILECKECGVAYLSDKGHECESELDQKLRTELKQIREVNGKLRSKLQLLESQARKR